MSKQEIFYTSPNGAGGDIIPFYDNGEYRLFFLGKGWTCVSTKDHLHFHDEYKTGIYGGTGSVLKVDGVYHMFYCKFTFHPYMRQYVCHATSEDMVNWVEHPAETFQPDDVIYEMSDWRDPHVIWNEEAAALCTANQPERQRMPGHLPVGRLVVSDLLSVH